MPSTFANRLEQPWTVELHPHTYTWLCVTTPIHFHKHVYQIYDEALEEFYFGNYSKLIFIGEQEGSLEASLLCLCACARYLISAVSRQAVQSMKGCTICSVPLTTRQDSAPSLLLKRDMIPSRDTRWGLWAHCRMTYSLLN